MYFYLFELLMYMILLIFLYWEIHHQEATWKFKERKCWIRRKDMSWERWETSSVTKKPDEFKINMTNHDPMSLVRFSDKGQHQRLFLQFFVKTKTHDHQRYFTRIFQTVAFSSSFLVIYMQNLQKQGYF